MISQKISQAVGYRAVALSLSGLLLGCAAAHDMVTNAGTAASNFGKNLVPQAKLNGTVTTNGKTQSLWPVDTAIIPPPTVFLATNDNVQTSAPLPVAAANNVLADPQSDNRFTVEISQVDQIGTKQQNDTLCWAACTQTLLKQQNIQVQQTQLAQQFAPDNGDDDEDQSAGLGVVIRALNPDLEPQLEQKGAVPIDLVAITSDQMLSELMTGRLCIVGLVEQEGDSSGHACIVCGATFAQLKPSLAGMLGTTVAVNPNAKAHSPTALQSGLNPQQGLYSVDLFDPWTGTHRTLSGQDFCDQTAFIISRQLARDILMAALQAPNTGNAVGRLVVKSKTRSDKDRIAARSGKAKLASQRTGPDKPKDKPADKNPNKKEGN